MNIQIEQLTTDYKLRMESEQNILKNTDHSARNFIQKTKWRIEVLSQAIKDLQSLQPTTEEREVKIYNPSDHCPKCNWLFNRIDKFCSWCWAKINRVD